MKTIATFLLFFFSVLCKAQETKYIDSTKYKVEVTQWSENNDCYSWFNKYVKTKDSVVSFITKPSTPDSIRKYLQYSCIKINKNLDTIDRHLVRFTFPLDDYTETEKAYYTINASRNTMNEDDGAFLCKYNKKWKKIWEKKIRTSTAPDDDFVLNINEKNELIIVSDDEWINGKPNLNFERFTLNGKFISHKKLPNKYSQSIYSVLKTQDKNFLILSSFYNTKSQKSYLELIKINQIGSVIWRKQYSEMNVEHALITKDQNIILFGNTSIYDSIKNTFRHSLKTLLVDNNGKLVFEKAINNVQYEYEANCVNETNEETFVYSSYAKRDSSWDKKIFLFELTRKGEIIFEKSIEDKPTTDLHIFKNSDKNILLANSYYTPNWYYKHEAAIQFIKLTK